MSLSDNIKSDPVGFEKSKARWTEAGLKGIRPELPRYFRRPREVDTAIDACMNEHGRKNCTKREYLGLDEKGVLEFWAVILDAKGEVLAAYNNSFLCPPWCDDELPA